MIVRSRSLLPAALALGAVLLLTGCYGKYAADDEDMPQQPSRSAAADEAKKPAQSAVEREQAKALAEQKAAARKRAESSVKQTTLASVEEEPVKEEPAKEEPAKEEKPAALATVSPKAGGYWVQVGSGRNEKDSEALWKHVKAAHPTILADASHAIVRADLGPGKGVFYRVHVGPYDSAKAARALCGRLRAANTDCFIVAPGGVIMMPPAPARASVEPATQEQEEEQAKPETGIVKEKPAVETGKSPAKETAKPAATARQEAPAKKPEAPAKESTTTETKPAQPKTDVPFRSMGLPGLPD